MFYKFSLFHILFYIILGYKYFAIAGSNYIDEYTLPHEEKVNDIFYLLNDFEYEDDFSNRQLKNEDQPDQINQNWSPVDSEKESKIHDNPHDSEIFTDETNMILDTNEIQDSYDDSNFNFISKIQNIDLTTLKSYVHMLKLLRKSTPHKSNTIDDLLSTITKVTEMYDEKTKKKHKFNSKNEQHGNETEPEGILKSTSQLISYLLDPPNMERVFEISRDAQGEDEILDHLTSVILGAEDRSGGGYGGYGLTLDPVTCIALLTLAAYLIRAVFQILSVTTAAALRARSLPQQVSFSRHNYHNTYSGFQQPDEAEYMAVFDDMMAKSHHRYSRIRRDTLTNSLSDQYELYRMPSELALFVKLSVDDSRACLSKFICHHLNGRFGSKFGVSELFWSIVSLYKGEYKFWKYLIDKNDSACEKSSFACEGASKTDCSSCSSEEETSYLRLQTVVNKLVQEYLNARHGGTSPT